MGLGEAVPLPDPGTRGHGEGNQLSPAMRHRGVPNTPSQLHSMGKIGLYWELLGVSSGVIYLVRPT